MKLLLFKLYFGICLLIVLLIAVFTIFNLYSLDLFINNVSLDTSDICNKLNINLMDVMDVKYINKNSKNFTIFNPFIDVFCNKKYFPSYFVPIKYNLPNVSVFDFYYNDSYIIKIILHEQVNMLRDINDN